MTNVLNLLGPKEGKCNIFRTKNVLLNHHEFGASMIYELNNDTSQKCHIQSCSKSSVNKDNKCAYFYEWVISKEV